MNDWSNFFMAIVSAAAALTGLIFVGVSMSLTKILSIPRLPERALESLVLLLNAVVVSALCLVPAQSALVVGIELSFIGVVTWMVTLRIDLGILRKTEAVYKKYSVQNIVFTQVSVLPFLAGGIITFLHGFAGIYWLVPGIVFSLIKSLSDAWVLLVEIHR